MGSSFAFLANVNEILGYTHELTLNSSYAVIIAMMQECYFRAISRNKKDDEDEYFEHIDFDGNIQRIKKTKEPI
ncbi:MAG: hypothetical protein ACRDDZ_01260 [Marinifilaceae bacterium]